MMDSEPIGSTPPTSALTCSDAHVGVGAPAEKDQAEILPVLPTRSGSAWSFLGFLASALDDVERTRIAIGNRQAAAERAGFTFSVLGDLAGRLEEADAVATKELEKCMAGIPGLGPFVKNTKGLGLKSVARFLGCVGHPRWKPVRGPKVETEAGKLVPGPIIGWQPRTVSALWRYCGLDVRDGKAPTRKRGEVAGWNANARKRAYVMAVGCIKHRSSDYRATYDAARLKYETVEISDGHKHQRGIRAVMKEILKDLWRNAR